MDWCCLIWRLRHTLQHSIPTCKQFLCYLTQVLLSANPPASLGLVNDWGLTAAALAEVKGHKEPRDVLIAAGGTVAGLHTFYPLHAAAISNDAGDDPIMYTICSFTITCKTLPGICCRSNWPMLALGSSRSCAWPAVRFGGTMSDAPDMTLHRSNMPAQSQYGSRSTRVPTPM